MEPPESSSPPRDVFASSYGDLVRIFNGASLDESWSQEGHWIRIDALQPWGTSPSDTDKLRKIVKHSLDTSDGRLVVLALGTSHIFFLRMGMIPRDYLTTQADKLFGPEGVKALEDLREGRPFDPCAIGIIFETQTSLPPSPAAIQAHKTQLIQLLDTKVSTDYFQKAFFPRLLRILAKDQGVHPDTSELDAVEMILSEEGKRRWREAIENDRSFPVFRRFEHLNSFMTPEQKTQLTQVLSPDVNMQEGSKRPPEEHKGSSGKREGGPRKAF